MPKLMDVLSAENDRLYRPVSEQQFSEAEIMNALDLIENRSNMLPHRWEYAMKEAITTSDFPYLFGQIIDRQMIAQYKIAVADWKSFFKMGTAKDFNYWYSERLEGADGLLPLVSEKGEYLVAPVANSHYYGRVYKRGKQFDISWEALINDQLGAFANFPQRFATAAMYTEAYLAAATYSSATGPNAALFGAPIADVNGQNVTNLGTLPLTILNLETTLELMAGQLDMYGKPITVQGVHLVVPPALKFTAMRILSASNIMWTESAGGAAVPHGTANVVSQVGLKLHVDPLLPVIDVGGNVATTWYLFADPSQGAALEFRYLRGHETPEICMKASDKVTVAGGALSPFSGDFATDNVFYRVRIVPGSTQLDPRFAYSQNGTG